LCKNKNYGILGVHFKGDYYEKTTYDF